MLCTDSVKDVTIHPALADRIPTQNIDCVVLDELIAEFLRRNCCLRIALCPEEMHTFSENSNSRMLHLRRLCSPRDQISKSFHKQSWIRHTVKQECREHVSRVQRHKPTLLDRSSDIQART